MMRKVLAAAAVTALFGAAMAYAQCQIDTSVPFASEFDTPLKHYNRAGPHLATAGELKPEDMAQLWDYGFDVVVDARPAEPDVIAAERKLVEDSGMIYHHLPYTDEGISAEDLATFTALVEDPMEYRILLHCKLGNRAGAMLASYYLAAGIDRNAALMAGRAAGMRLDMEEELVARLDAP